MTTPQLRFTALALATLLAPHSGARAQNTMPADCPMHARHQAEKAAAAAVEATANPNDGAGRAMPAAVEADASSHAGHGAPAASGSAANPYSSLAPRTIAALSDDEIAALRAGTGLGTALPAELHHYPGPRHLIDQADALGLSETVVASLQGSFDRMHARAVALGEQLIAAEQELDRLFAEGRATAAEVSRLTGESARLRGELRAAHLVAHVEARELLTAEQVVRYDELRGYAARAGGSAGN